MAQHRLNILGKGRVEANTTGGVRERLTSVFARRRWVMTGLGRVCAFHATALALAERVKRVRFLKRMEWKDVQR